MKKIMILLAAVMLVLVTSTAWAVPTINIYDLGEGDLKVYSDDPDIWWEFNFFFPIIKTAPNFASVLDILVAPNFQTPGLYGVRMLEPANEGGGVSDFAILWISEPFFDQPYILTFVSEGAIGFAPTLAAYESLVDSGYIFEPKAPFVEEDNILQNLFDFPGLVVNAASFVFPAPVLTSAPVLTAAPVPGSVLLCGTGILGLAGFRKKLQ